MLPLLAFLACDPAIEPEPSDTGEIADVPRGALQLRVPQAEPERFTDVIGFDHDPEVYEGIEQLRCSNYLGNAFPHCYDEHHGTDLMLDGGFDAMDAGSATIVAAADGLVVYAEDGHYDRCHGSLETGATDCDGHDGVANAVILQHTDADGGTWHTQYWHMKQDSVAVAEGDVVAVGDTLGLVGSSGNSTAPHLHFGLSDADEAEFDPYAGPYSQAETWWCAQNDEDELPGLCGG